MNYIFHVTNKHCRIMKEEYIGYINCQVYMIYYNKQLTISKPTGKISIFRLDADSPTQIGEFTGSTHLFYKINVGREQKFELFVNDKCVDTTSYIKTYKVVFEEAEAVNVKKATFVDH